VIAELLQSEGKQPNREITMASKLTHKEFDKRVLIAMQPAVAGAKAPATIGGLLEKMKERGKPGQVPAQNVAAAR